MKKVNCDHCKTTFLSFSELKDHLVKEGVSKQYRCEQCDTSFYNEWRLKKHMRNHSCNMKRRNCYYYNQGLDCPFEYHGCKFIHTYSEACKFGRNCSMSMCQFRHFTQEDLVQKWTATSSIPTRY